MHCFENKVAVITGENICIDGGQTKLMISMICSTTRSERWGQRSLQGAP